MEALRLALVQYAPVWEDRAATRRKLSALLETDRGEADWIIFPEMALSGFTMRREASTWDADDFAYFAELALSRRATVTVGGVEGGRNVALVFGPGGSRLATCAKRHLFSFSGEDKAYVAGEETGSYRVAGLPVAQAVCYDLRFPYHFWPEAPRVDAYCVIAAWGGRRAAHWTALLRARAIENQAFVVGVNRVGEEPGVSYAGGSAVFGPEGDCLLDCGQSEGIFRAGIDPAAVSGWRAAFRALEDRRA